MNPLSEGRNKRRRGRARKDPVEGDTVSGVVDGGFEGGYLLSVRIGNSICRGVAFKPADTVQPLTPHGYPTATMTQLLLALQQNVMDNQVHAAQSPSPSSSSSAHHHQQSGD